MTDIPPWITITDDHEGSSFEYHTSCPSCDSSDALAVFSDGHGWCYSCSTYHKEVEGAEPIEYKETHKVHDDLEIHNGKTIEIKSRGLSLDTAKKYGVQISVRDGKPDSFHFPYYAVSNINEHVSYKVRKCDAKDFHTKGDHKRAGLFGQQLFPSGRGKLTLTEGEFDAMAAYQMQGSRFPCVSIPSGADSAVKSCKQNYEYLNGFEEIVICFDNDPPGREAASKVADLFPGKAKVVSLKDYKDANEYLINGDSKKFISEWWGAEAQMPDGLVNGKDLRDRIKNKQAQECIPSPWEGLDELTYGYRLQEMWTIIAGSGVGKTTVLREMEHHLLKNTDYNIGALFLEESAEDAGEGLMSIEANAPLHLPDTEISDQEWDDAFNATLGTGRVTYYDAFGESDIDRLLSRITWMAKALDCKVIFLDHISIIVSEQSNGDERKALDEIATKLKKLTMSLDILLLMVSHTRRNNTKSHEEGGQTSLADIRGTAGIGQLSNMVLGIERNGQADTEKERNTTTIRVVKNRYTGRTGPACQLEYSKYTGRLKETEAAFEEEDDNDET